MSWLDALGKTRSAQGVAARSAAGPLLVTGSSGRVASLVVPLLRARGYVVRLADRRADGDERADLLDPATCDRLTTGMRGVVHLAGASKEGPVEGFFTDNTVALANLLHSAVRAGVTHFVFASSMHVMGMYRRDERFDESSEPRPDSYYAASKLHGEALCRLFHEKAGLTVTCLRLGSVTAEADDADPGAWISPEDVAALIDIGLVLEPPSFEIFHAVADHKGSPLPQSRAHRHGFRCARPAGDYESAMRKVRAWWHDDDAARSRRGGSFASERLKP